MRRTSLNVTRLIRWSWIGLCLILVTACHQDMYDQPKFRTYAPSDFFADGRSARPPVNGSVAVGQVQTDAHFFTGRVDGQEVDTMPFPVTREVLDRGRLQFNIYCAPCHGQTGNGQGVVSQRGAVPAANFHDPRLVNGPVGHFYVVMTEGYRYMYSYASRITPDDRWAIAAYIRALQLSQNTTLDNVPAAERAKLESQP